MATADTGAADTGAADTGAADTGAADTADRPAAANISGRDGLIAGLLVALIVAANWYLPLQGVPLCKPPRLLYRINAYGGCLDLWLPHRLIPSSSGYVLAAWLVTLAAIVALLAVAGNALNGRPSGVLIDNRNRISLSKLQMVGWTVLILSGAITIGAVMLAQLDGAPATIDIPTTLLTLMGISLGTTAAVPAVLSVTKGGQVDKNETAAEARWTDLVQGDDTSNADAPDISKIQQLLITALVMGVYAFQLGDIFHYGFLPGADGKIPPIHLPDLGAQLVWLVGISHAGYLTYKGVSHGPDKGAGDKTGAGKGGDDRTGGGDKGADATAPLA